jgi:hypothetical protein
MIIARNALLNMHKKALPPSKSSSGLSHFGLGQQMTIFQYESTI